MHTAIEVYAGREAARQLREHGWQPELFSLLLGASGGPKWLVLAELDRYLFGEFLGRSSAPLTALGSSVGAWRHACLVQHDPGAAIDRFAHAYLEQRYSAKPAPAEISRVGLDMLDQLLGGGGVGQLLEHPRIRTAIVTARGRGANASAHGAPLAAGMGVAALGNGLDRRLLQGAFQRVLFHTDTPPTGLPLHGFSTRHVALSAANARAALHATGSIPFVLAGERDIPGAPRGQYWDGGIIDYHFDLRACTASGLILFPHFRADITPGWFDKFLPWRRLHPRQIDRLVLLCPSRHFVASLPGGKIPDRTDFTRFDERTRRQHWHTCIMRSAALADELRALVAGDDPLRGVHCAAEHATSPRVERTGT